MHLKNLSKSQVILRNPSHILVTGGAGFIGSAFIRHLLTATTFDGSIINFDSLTYAGNLNNLNSVADDPRYRFVQGDICDESLVKSICIDYAIDTIVHFAAESHVDRSIQSPKKFLQTNILGTFYLLEVVRQLPHIHFHHVSTDEVYGTLGETGYFTEDSPYRPNSPYSASKASSDHFVNAYHHTYGLSTTLSNCSNNYGPFQFPEKLIPLILLNCLNNLSLPIYGKGLQIRDWLYVDDHVEAIWSILRLGKSGETYNIGGGEEMQNLELVHLMIDILAKMTQVSADHYKQLITFVTDRQGHDFRYAIDCSKIKESTGWHPKHSFIEGLTKTIEWYLNSLAIS